MPLNPHKDGPELGSLREAEEGGRGDPHNFLPILREVQPSLQRQSKPQGLGMLGWGEGGGGTGTYGTLHHCFFHRVLKLYGISSQWCIECFMLYFFFNYRTILIKQLCFLALPPLPTCHSSARLSSHSPLDSNFPFC